MAGIQGCIGIIVGVRFDRYLDKRFKLFAVNTIVNGFDVHWCKATFLLILLAEANSLILIRKVTNHVVRDAREHIGEVAVSVI